MATTNTEIQLLVTAKDQASSTLKKVGTSMEGVAKIGKTIAAGLAVAGSAAVAFGVSAVKSFNESEKATKQLEAVLKSTGNAAGLFKEDILDQAAALQKMTTFSDEAILSAQNMLLTFTNVKGPVFQESIETILNMSTALGQDATQSAMQLGKALNDPIRGVTALRRVGVTFTEDQQKQIETLVKSGKTMEAQRLILKELGTEFGGSAAAQAETFAGKIEQLKNKFDDLKEVVGGQIVVALTPALEELNTKLSEFSESEEGQEQIRTLTEAFITLGAAIAKTVESIIHAAMYLGEQLGIASVKIEERWAALGERMSEIGTKIKNVWKGVRDFINGLWDGMYDAFFNAMKKIADKIDKIIARYNDLPGTPNISEIRLQRQFGGPVQSGRPYTVGEHGPETFIPSQSGVIKPNEQGSRGGVTINIINPPMGMDVKSVVDQVKRAISREQELTRIGAM